MASKHADDSKSGGIDALLPSLLGVTVLLIGVMARMGFRGRSTVAGIDLGTTNSVVCVQSQKSSAGVGEIICVSDPATNSPVVPSVVSFLDNHHRKSFRLTKEERERHGDHWGRGGVGIGIPSSRTVLPHPVDVVVGRVAKGRIDGHPHHTVYHSKRIIGRDIDHPSVASLRSEVDFDVVPDERDGNGGVAMAAFGIPYHLPRHSDAVPSMEAASTIIASSSSSSSSSMAMAILSPSEIGSYIIHHLMNLVRDHLGHDNVKSAVIAIPAKFEPSQRDATIRAYEMAGIKVARILEEPTAAALAYGLHKRDDVHYVMVYDFGGGTLDVSMLYVGEGGYIEVLGSDGDEQLGGADFDAAVTHWLLGEKGGMGHVDAVSASLSMIIDSMTGYDDDDNVEDAIEMTCPKLREIPLCTISSLHTIGERMKIGLSDHPDEPGAIVEEACYRPMEDLEEVPNTAEKLCDSIYPVTLSLTLEEYNLAVGGLYERGLVPVRRLLKDLALREDEIDEVVMVGGTTRMPQIRELVRKELKKERLNTHIDPDLTVAYGAASVID
jgi:molecular chaperone DnaK (HSP70)